MNGLPWFDIVVLAILLTSAGFGFVSGATREMVRALSFVLAAVIAIYGLKRPQRLVRIAELADVIVLEHIGIVIAGQPHETGTGFLVIGDAGGVLQIGHDV